MRIRNMSQFSGKYHGEFIKTGVTPEEWDATFGYDDLDIGLV